MNGKNVSTYNRAARMIASIFGVLAGVGGLTHGIGETLQGNVAPSGITIYSWTEGPIATSMGGDPAMTVVPNLLITGWLTIVISIIMMVFAAAFIQRKGGGLIQILLSIVMLLTGGGFAPPVVGILAGIAGLGIRSPLAGWRKRLSAKIRDFLALLWPWIFGICVINGVFLVIGSLILVYFFALNNPGLFVNSFFLAIISLILSIITGIAYDLQKGVRSAGALR